jgi:hypothetical protein
MKKVFIISLAVIFGFALVMGCAPEEKAKTEEKAAAEAPAKTTFVSQDYESEERRIRHPRDG